MCGGFFVYLKICTKEPHRLVFSGRRIDDSSDTQRCLSLFRCQPRFADGFFVRIETHAAAIDGGDGERPKFKVNFFNSRIAGHMM